MSSMDLLDFERRYHLDELDTFPDDGLRYELADGWLLVSPQARRRHAVGCVELGRLLEATCPTDYYVFPLPINVDDTVNTWFGTHFEPDLTVVRRAFRDVDNGDLPLLVVEVRSPSTAGRDAVYKRRGYARLGIPSYWLFDVDVPSLRVLELRAAGYVEVAYAVGDRDVTVERPFPLTVNPARLLR